MELSESKINEYMHRILAARTRLLCTNGFYGLLLMHMKFALDDTIDTAATDGEKTYFSPRFLNNINDKELDFVLMHEVLHVVLQHCSRYEGRDKFLFNIACDIVVNSNILHSNGMDEKSITLKKYGVSIHIAPNGKEGYLYTAEQVYKMLVSKCKELLGDIVLWDNHNGWGKHPETSRVYEEWIQHFKDTCESIGARNGQVDINVPLFVERVLDELKNPQIDWRILLNDFIQEDPCDYSFFPPDKRFSNNPFVLPDFNEYIESVKNILFLVDTSGSIQTDELTMAYSEIKGAIEQFNNRLHGKLAFFDSDVKEPIRDFEDVESLLKIKPIGGGGTSFHVIFKYIKEKMIDDLPSMIVILTDGEASYPTEDKALNIPVLWLINNDNSTPPWGKVGRIRIYK